MSKHGMKLKKIFQATTVFDGGDICNNDVLNILSGILLLFQIIMTLILDLPFKQWQKEIPRFMWQGRKKPRVEHERSCVA